MTTSISEKKKILKAYFIDTTSNFVEIAVHSLGLKYVPPVHSLEVLYSTANIFGLCGMYETGALFLQFNGQRFITDERDLDEVLYDYYEYPAYASSSQIGALKETNWKNICQCAIAHEIVHCIAFSCYVPAILENFLIFCKKLNFDPAKAKAEVDTVDGSSAAAHGKFFQAGLKFLRPKMYKPVKGTQ